MHILCFASARLLLTISTLVQFTGPALADCLPAADVGRSDERGRHLQAEQPAVRGGFTAAALFSEPASSWQDASARRATRVALLQAPWTGLGAPEDDGLTRLEESRADVPVPDQFSDDIPNSDTPSTDPPAVPEPGSFVLVATGAAFLITVLRKGRYRVQGSSAGF